MLDAPMKARWSSRPLWLQLTWLTPALIGSVIAAASTAGFIVYAGLPSEQRILAYLGIASGLTAGIMAVVDAFQTNRGLRWTGLGLAVAAPFVAWQAGVDPILTWNLSLFATQLLVVNGLPVWCAVAPALGSALAVLLWQHTWAFNADMLVAGGATLAFAIVGHTLRTRRMYWDQVDLRTQELITARDAAVARGLAEERLRIARDLHDLIGHEIAAVNLRLGAAEIHLDQTPGQVRADLAAARASIQRILAETQHLLAVLRDGAADSALADYSQLETLIATTQDSGLEVEYTLPGPPPGLAPATSRAAYRIVQEMLTNAAKHGTGSVSIQIGADDGQLAITAVNLAAGPSESDTARVGLGLVGMKERAASVGGSVTTDRDRRLFWTRARLPLDTTRTDHPKPQEEP